MTTTTETAEAPAAAPARRPGRFILIGAAAAVAAALIALAALTVTGQSAQITALRGQVASASKAIATAQASAAAAQAKAAAASSDAQQVSRTQASATNANLGVCVSYGDGLGQQTVVTSPIRSAGGAVSCYSGTFTPVSPQAQPNAG